MKYFLLVVICWVFILTAPLAQDHKAEILKEPAQWEFEKFPLPPAFAPAITYKGTEELRFAPGMFNKDSAGYFTYIFVTLLENTTAISQDDVRNYLLSYYKGLCNITANDRKLVIDTTQINAVVEKKKNTGTHEPVYDAVINIFGVFTDGAPVRLNLEIKVVPDITNKRTYLLFIASPQAKSHAIWKTLYKVQKDFRVPG